MLRDEQGKSEKLLLNILPMEIAAILKNENRVIVDRYEGASVMFADIVNFTPMSVNMSPEDMMTLLNDIFSYFDRMVDKYGLEKIKTIGDCYMVASGVPRYRTDHAQAIVTMALEIQEYMRITPFHGRKISFRIGINSGTIVAGVIGQKKFAYDLWGDAVNTASRMESHGAEGMIQITRATYDLIQDEFDCKPKGIVNVKGKGEMEVWYVSSAHANRP
jgi:adenylate cyclase